MSVDAKVITGPSRLVMAVDQLAQHLNANPASVALVLFHAEYSMRDFLELVQNHKVFGRGTPTRHRTGGQMILSNGATAFGKVLSAERPDMRTQVVGLSYDYVSIIDAEHWYHGDVLVQILPRLHERHGITPTLRVTVDDENLSGAPGRYWVRRFILGRKETTRIIDMPVPKV